MKIVHNLDWRLTLRCRNVDTVVFQYNINKFSIYVLIVNKLFSNYKFTSNVIKDKLILIAANLDFYVYIYPCCLRA